MNNKISIKEKVSSMMLLTRLVDGASDLFVGGVINKTKTRWGKSRPWLLL